MEFLKNMRSWENQKLPENCQKSGLFWASPFTRHLVCTLLILWKVFGPFFRKRVSVWPSPLIFEDRRGAILTASHSSVLPFARNLKIAPKVHRRGCKKCFGQLEKGSPKSLKSVLHQCNLAPVQQPFGPLVRKILVSVKFLSAILWGAGNGCANFVDAWKNASVLQEKPCP